MPLIGRKKVEEEIDALVKETNNKLVGIVTNGFTKTVLATPVHFKDGGRLRGGWNLSIGKENTNTTNSMGSQAALSQLVKMPSIILGKKIFFTNPLPYANLVEYGGYPSPPENGTWTGEQYEVLSSGGFSKQAPSGMARINVTKMQTAIKKL